MEEKQTDTRVKQSHQQTRQKQQNKNYNGVRDELECDRCTEREEEEEEVAEEGAAEEEEEFVGENCGRLIFAGLLALGLG